MNVVLDENARLPQKAHKADACYDLYAKTWTCLRYGGSYDIDTGVHIAIPHGCVGLVLPKSGLMFNNNVVADIGVIDSGYTGSIHVHMINRDHNKLMYIVTHQKIAQLLIFKIYDDELVQVESLEETERGDGGFGSTGK